MELDDDTEGLQATIYLLQQQLKEAKDRIDFLEGNDKPSDLNNTDQPVEVSSEETPTESTLTTATISKPSESLTLPEQSEAEVTPSSENNSEVIPNGTCEQNMEAEPAVSDKVTSGSTDDALNSNVGNNGFTEMMVTN